LVNRIPLKWIAFILVVLALVVGSLVCSNLKLFWGSTSTSTITTKSSNTSTIPSLSSEIYVCVRVVSDGDGKPIEGVELHCSPATVQNGTTTMTTIDLSVKTGPDGWACVSWTSSNTMTFRTVYQGQLYEFSVPMSSEKNFIALLSVPSGKVITTTQTQPLIVYATYGDISSTEISYGITYANGSETLTFEAKFSNTSVKVGGIILMKLRFIGPDAYSVGGCFSLTVINAKGEKVFDIGYMHSHMTTTPGIVPPQEEIDYVGWKAEKSTYQNEVLPGTYTLLLETSDAKGNKLTIREAITVE